MAVSNEAPARRTYGNWRKPKSAGLLGLGKVGTALLFVCMAAVLITLMFGSVLKAGIMALVSAGALLTLVFRDRHDRTLLERMISRVSWWPTKTAKRNLYRSGPLGRTKWGTYQLPGIGAQTQLDEYQDSYARPFALIHTPISKTYTVVIEAEPDGESLVDQLQIDTWVADWGHYLAALGTESGVMQASVVVETAPDWGTTLRREVTTNVDPNAPEFSRKIMDEIVESYPAGASSVRAYVTLTFNAVPRKGAKARKREEMAREIATRLPNLTANLQATGAGAARPVDAQRLCEIVRVAYDPAMASLIDDAHAEGAMPELQWTEVGPSAHQASWTDFTHDSGRSKTWVMSLAPRGNVQANILTRLLSPHKAVARKRVTFLYRPIDPGTAAKIVEADFNAARFNATGKKSSTAGDTVAVRAADATRNEEASGAGLVNFAMIVTGTVRDTDPADADAAIENAGTAARIQLRPSYGSQDAAFAFGLPLGLVPSKHAQTPAFIEGSE